MPCLRETNWFWTECEAPATKTRMQNMYCEGILEEGIEEIVTRLFQSDARVRLSFKKPTCFEQNLKLERNLFRTCKTTRNEVNMHFDQQRRSC